MKTYLKKVWDSSLIKVLSAPLATLITLLVQWLWSWIKGVKLDSYILDHPGTVAFAAVLISGGIALTIRLKSFFETYLRNQAILSAVGLKAFWPHKTEAEKANDWRRCREEIEKECPDRIRIMGATGWDTFGSPSSPLHSLLEKFNGEIRILLIKPGCTAFEERAKALRINRDEYERQVNDSIEFCKRLKERGKSISVYLYEQIPIWKMVITPSYLWLQYYQPSDHVDNTPVYTFYANLEETSLYFPLRNVFQKRMEKDGNKPIV